MTIRATYRLQFSADLGFADATRLVPYLHDLGVSHVYASPVTRSQPGSTHGYDVIDHCVIDEELGGADAFEEFVTELRTHGLALVVDIVPNHMAATPPANQWWDDVLENGRASRFAAYFDIDWRPPETTLTNRILLPVLGDHYGRVLEARDLRVVRASGRIEVHYYEHRFPLEPSSLAEIFEPVATTLTSDELAFLASSLSRLPSPNATDPDEVERRQIDVGVLHRLIARACDDPDVARAVDQECDRLNEDIERLDALLARQNYRLARWQTSGQLLDYRRFFDVDNLVGLRTERQEVFDDIHRLVLHWVGHGAIEGLRIDHIDGLRDPQGYLDRLRAAAPDAWIVVEKILEGEERLRATWPVDGTTGYEFGALVGGLLVDPAGAAEIERVFTRFVTSGASETPRPFDESLRAAKFDVIRDLLASELNRVTESFVRVGEQHRRYRDFSRHELHGALRELLVAFAVYRTYVTDTGSPATEDVAVVDRAIGEARGHRPDIDPELFDLLRRILLADDGWNGPVERELRARFQQVSGAVMAKGKEDTAFYREVALLASNEVGADPNRPARDPDELHRWCAEVQESWPSMMLSLSTHDSKRSEDVRARLAVLSEMPERWEAIIARWHRRHAIHRGEVGPDPVTEYYIYETLVGAHPLPRDRAWTNVRKAMREAKQMTSWVQPDDTYEADVEHFLDALYDDVDLQRELEQFVGILRPFGRINSLAQKLVQLTAPGVPDIYQGNELWDLSLVDPDNRRPIDFTIGRDLLTQIGAGDGSTGPMPGVGNVDGFDPHGLEDVDDPGQAKLRLVSAALDVRRRHPDAFAPNGTYERIDARGMAADHLVVFIRGAQVVTAVPRCTLALREIDRAQVLIDLPAGSWRNALISDHVVSGTVTMAQLLGPFPVALLVLEGGL